MLFINYEFKINNFQYYYQFILDNRMYLIFMNLSCRKLYRISKLTYVGRNYIPKGVVSFV